MPTINVCEAVNNPTTSTNIIGIIFLSFKNSGNETTKKEARNLGSTKKAEILAVSESWPLALYERNTWRKPIILKTKSLLVNDEITSWNRPI